MNLRKAFLVSVVAALVTLSAASLAGADEVEGKRDAKTVGDVVVELIIKDGAARIGDNQIEVHLESKKTGQAIGKASVRVEPTMEGAAKGHGMDHGPAGVPLAAGEKAGVYVGTIKLDHAGEWEINVAFDSDGGHDAVTFHVQVAESGPNWYVIGGFAGALLGIIAGAAIIKRRGPAATRTASA